MKFELRLRIDDHSIAAASFNHHGTFFGERFQIDRKEAGRANTGCVAFGIERADGAVLLRRRPANGLLGAMMEFPSTEWRARKWSAAAAREQAPVDAEWTPLPGPVRHGFTHFRLELDVLAGRVDDGADGPDGVWCPPGRLGDYALPTLMRKVAAHALTALGR